MKRLSNYNDFLFDLIFESKGMSLPIKLSNRLITLLNKVDSPISKLLLKMHGDWISTDVTYIDYDDDNINNFTYALSNKIYDLLSKAHKEEDLFKISKLQDHYYRSNKDIWDKFRASSRIGRFINRVLPGRNEKEIEDFVNLIKLKRTQQFENFKIVEGDELLKFYLQSNYSREKGGSNPLYNSCMRYDKSQDYLQFYVDNNVKMIVLMSDVDKNKILGRAILWKLDKPENRFFMDRIYYVNDYDIENFKDYAKSNGWLYKKNQTRDPNDLICDPLTGNCERMTLVVENIKKGKYFAYLDTIAFFFDEKNILTNNNDYIDGDEDPFYLQSIDGGYMVGNQRFMSYYGRLVYNDDLIWCNLGSAYRLREDAIHLESSDEYATQEYADEHLVYSEWMDRFLDKNDSETIYLDNYEMYITNDYADTYLKYSEYIDNWLLKEDAVHSNHYNDYLPRDKTIQVIIGINKVKGEWKFDRRIKGDKTYKEYKYKEYTLYYDSDKISLKEIKDNLDE